MVQELVVDLPRYVVSFGDRQLRVNRDVDLGAQPVAYPPRPYFRNALYAPNVARRVSNLLDHLRVHPIRQVGEYGLAGLPDDHQDRHRDKEPHDGIRERVAEPHADGAQVDGQAGPAVGPRVVAVGDEDGAADLPANPDAEYGHRLVADEPDHRGCRDGTDKFDGPRVDKPVYGLVARDNGAEQDDEHDYHASQILHPPVTERESAARPQAGKSERDPKRHGCSRVAEVVDSVREE